MCLTETLGLSPDMLNRVQLAIELGKKHAQVTPNLTIVLCLCPLPSKVTMEGDKSLHMVCFQMVNISPLSFNMVPIPFIVPSGSIMTSGCPQNCIPDSTWSSIPHWYVLSNQHLPIILPVAVALVEYEQDCVCSWGMLESSEVTCSLHLFHETVTCSISLSLCTIFLVYSCSIVDTQMV